MKIKPLKFRELLKPTLWGGKDIVEIKGRTDVTESIGESWEISGMPGNETPVAEGEHEGMVLSELIELYGADLVGLKVFQCYGTKFPLLIKFISAAKPLSIQVHPNDKMAQSLGHPFGKTELWYILKSAPDSFVYSGFLRDFSPEAYTQCLMSGTLTWYIATHTTHPGDSFLIPPGRIHSIGAGNFLVEIQRSSDDTFRVYDFDRLDANGKKRELHVDLARAALDYKAADDYRQSYGYEFNSPVVIADCEYFTTRLLKLEHPLKIDYSALDSFVIYVAFTGKAVLTDAYGNEVELAAGQSVLFSANNPSVVLTPIGNSLFSCLETFIK